MPVAAHLGHLVVEEQLDALLAVQLLEVLRVGRRVECAEELMTAVAERHLEPELRE